MSLPIYEKIWYKTVTTLHPDKYGDSLHTKIFSQPGKQVGSFSKK